MMEAKGGCCIARYSGYPYPGGTQVDRIMLRFRPIAPKPATAPRCSDYAPTPAGGRAKRRCVRENRRCRKQRKPLPEQKAGAGSPPVAASPVVTLPLLPEAPEPKGSPLRDLSPSSHLPPALQMHPMWAPQVATRQAVTPSWTCVTVERVAELSGEGAWGLGGEEEIRKGLEAEDACPGLVTDAWNCVRWVNEAFRRMVGGKRLEISSGGGGGVMVALVAKEKLPEAETMMAFTCRVRVQYTRGDGERNSMTAPCDVWRLEGGGFAWRLDVKAALSLGR